MLDDNQLDNAAFTPDIDPEWVAPDYDPSLDSPEELEPPQGTPKGKGKKGGTINNYFVFKTHLVRHIKTLAIAHSLTSETKLNRVAGYIWRTFDKDTKETWKGRLERMEARCMEETGLKLAGHLSEWTLDLEPKEIVAEERVQTAICRFGYCDHGAGCAAGVAAALADPKPEPELKPRKRKNARSRGRAVEEGSPRARKRSRAGSAASDENSAPKPRRRRSTSSRSSSTSAFEHGDELFDMEALASAQAVCYRHAGEAYSRLPLIGSSSHNSALLQASPVYHTPVPEPQPELAYAATDTSTDPSTLWQESPTMHQPTYAPSPASSPQLPDGRFVFGAPGASFDFDFTQGLNFECDPEVLQQALADLRSTMHARTPAVFGFPHAASLMPVEAMGYSMPPSPWAPSSPASGQYLGHHSGRLDGHVPFDHAPWLWPVPGVGYGIDATTSPMASGSHRAFDQPFPVSYNDIGEHY